MSFAYTLTARIPENSVLSIFSDKVSVYELVSDFWKEI
ncbi:hypothetical protein M111_4368 [Bacteroides fragilis str. 3986T(B)10]|nr:hypothetical protein M080_3761 [Bacteroides fragilis str. 3397 T10]EXY58144.1 hypothetical protein M111_4368 [Bacteroides fragilis str. 3986T(B)10]EXZ08311.1 hypothetical protein M073_3761 [Bacteroides fragilis str. DS-71]